jgi:hypothetical protein
MVLLLIKKKVPCRSNFVAVDADSKRFMPDAVRLGDGKEMPVAFRERGRCAESSNPAVSENAVILKRWILWG